MISQRLHVNQPRLQNKGWPEFAANPDSCSFSISNQRMLQLYIDEKRENRVVFACVYISVSM